MDLTTLWQEQKSFILCVLGGLLVFFIGQALFSTLYGVDENRRRVASLESSLRRTRAPATSQLDVARDRNEKLNDRYLEALERVNFKPDPKYVLSVGEKPDIQYDRLFNEARDSLVEGAKTLNITVDPRLGMPELSPTRRGEIQEALTALDIVTRVVLLAVESQIAQVESISMVPDTGRRKQRDLREQRIKLKMQGTAPNMAEFLQRFTTQEQFLAIETGRFEISDPDGAWVEAEFTVSALEIITEESEISSSLNKEQILFILTLALLGTLAYTRLDDRVRHRSVPRAGKAYEVETQLPCAELQFIESEHRFYRRDGRNIFAPPRDWLPLEHLILDFPPLLELEAVAPFTSPGLGAAFFAQYRLLPDPDAFRAGDEGEEFTAMEEGGQASAGESPDGFDLDDTGGVEDKDSARESGYDWLQLAGRAARIHGRILNDDKYALLRNKEPVRFEQVTLRTGSPLGVFEYSRDRLHDFGFADTVVNRIELAIRELSFHAGNLKAIHEKVRWCLSLREEDPKAVDYAVDLARRAIDLDPLSKESYALLADLYEEIMDYEQAIRVLRNAIDQRLNAPGVYVRYGNWLRRYGLDDAASAAYKEAENLQPAHAGALVARAELAFDKGDFTEALSLFEEAWRSPSWQPELKIKVLIGEGRCLLALNRLDVAIGKVQRAVNLGEDAAEAYNLKGAVLLAQGDLSGAEEAFRRAAALSPDRGDYLTNLGCVLLREGCAGGGAQRIRDGVRKFEEAADVDPYASCRALAALGFALECLGEDDQASSAYERAIRVDPEDYYARYLWGRNQRRLGDTAAAIETLKIALQYNDRMVEILGELGYASLLAGLDEDAAFYFEEYEKRAPGDFRLRYLHGLALLKQNRIDEAITRFRESIALAGDNPDPDNGLAYALHAQGIVDESLAAFGRVLRRFAGTSNDPRYRYARQWMTRLEEHRRKSQWLDGFDRKAIKNDWNLVQRTGPKINLIGNQVVMQGVQRQEQGDLRTALRREIPGKTFRIFEADLSAAEGNQARCGIYLGLYISRGAQGALSKAEVILALEPNGALTYNVIDKGKETVQWQPLEQEPVAPGTPVRLGIEVVDYEEGRLRLFVNGEPVLPEDLVVKSLKKCSRDLMVGIFGAAPGSRNMDLTADNARIVVRN